MRRFTTPFLILVCLTALTIACYGRALFRGEQFSYRDAAHFYYPLYERVQQEWKAGRWPPLWEPEENAGMPLLGNPTAAVLYPGKLIFAAVPYPLGVRLYAAAHTLLAFGAMLALLRSWGTSWTGSALGGLAYAFGAPVLFQYCNIIYLVGAAWVPLGVRAADRWLRLGKRWALLELAVVLAMETLGGDPECAYLTGVCVGGYAGALAWGRTRRRGDDSTARGWRPGVVILLTFVAVTTWTVGTIAIASRVPDLRPPTQKNQPVDPLPWMPWVSPAITAAWGFAGFMMFLRWRKMRRDGTASLLMPMLAGLAGSAVLAGLLSAAQLLPVLEFTGQSGRAAGDGPHDIHPFSLEPTRMVEFLWPNVFGTSVHGNRSWFSALPPRDNAKIWVPSLYVGGLTIVLALGASGFRNGPPWRAWMTVIAVVSLLGSLGEYTSPLWWARFYEPLTSVIGPHDPSDVASIRFDRHLRDGDGGVYWFLATVLPGFKQFRFPSKLLTFTVLAVAALAAQGWDALALGDSRTRRRTAGWAWGLIGVTLIVLLTTLAKRSAFIAFVAEANVGSMFGPIDAPGAFQEAVRGLSQGLFVFAVALALAWRADRRVGLASVLALGVMTADLALANAGYIFTVPQKLMDTVPEVVSIIEAAEKEKPSPGPYRVHRMPIWNPISWLEQVSEDRVRDFVAWERKTIQPKYGLPYHVQYTTTLGVAELYDYEWFFGGFHQQVDANEARLLGIAPGDKVVVFPRRSFDIWNTRYFVVPYYPNKWADENRGFASFLDKTERIYPPPDAFRGPDREAKEIDWIKNHDFQILRNFAEYPRAWVVHGGRFLKSIQGLTRSERNNPMKEILYSEEPFWQEEHRTVYDPKQLAWLDEKDKGELAPFTTGGNTSREETVTVTAYQPERVELDAYLEKPGMVILSDVYYPGWTLTIDGKPSPVYRANRMMRGAAVDKGRHTLVYTYNPRSFRIGLWASCAGLVTLCALGIAFAVRPVSATLRPLGDTEE